MNPAEFFRLVRRGWPIVIAMMLIGALVGYGSTLRSSDSDSAEVTYFESRRTVVTDPLAVTRADFELSQQALFATSGVVPVSVAEELGLDPSEVVRRLRSVTDVALGSITLIVVAETSAEADATAEAISNEFVDLIGERERAQFVNARILAENEVERLEQVLIDLDIEIAAEQVKLEEAAAEAEAESGTTTTTTEPAGDKEGEEPAEGDTVQPRPADLRDLELQREVASQRYADAVDELDRRNALPDPLSPLSVLDEAGDPIEITESAYNQRIRAGEAGQRNFLARDVSLETERVRPLSTTTSNGILRALMGAVAGLLIGLIALVVRTRLDPRVRTPEEASIAYGAPVLAAIPTLGRKDRGSRQASLVLRSKPLGQTSDRFRRLRASLDRSTARANPRRDGLFHIDSRTIVVVSASPSEDTSFVAANLAMAYVEAGLGVVLFDFDHRRSSVHEYFSEEPTNGAFRRIEENLYIWSTESGLKNPTAIVNQQRQFLSDVRGDADIAIVRASPLLTTSETLEILSTGDEVVPVFAVGESTLVEVEQLKEIAERHALNVAGITVTRASRSRRSMTREYFSESGSIDEPKTLPAIKEVPESDGFQGFTAASTPAAVAELAEAARGSNPDSAGDDPRDEAISETDSVVAGAATEAEPAEGAGADTDTDAGTATDDGSEPNADAPEAAEAEATAAVEPAAAKHSAHSS